MGKKSKEPSEDTTETVKTLFGSDNPFRRKPQPDAAASEPTTKLGLKFDSRPVKKEAITEAKISVEGAADGRKRKRGRGIISAIQSPLSSAEEIQKKRKKLVDEIEGQGLKKKRKRSEVESEYEKRKYGLLGEDEAAAAVVVAVGEKRKADDAAADMLGTNESFDDESKLLRTVFVGNLPLKTKRKALIREFAMFGEIESVRIRSVPLVDTKTPRKAAVIRGQINEEADSINAYIVFKDEQSAHAALSQNMAQVGGNHIRVDMACPPRKKMKGEVQLYDRKRTAFVGNLPFDVKDEELYQLFCGLSPSEPNVEAVRVIRDPNTSVGKGIAYVLFKTRDAANKICKRRDLKIRDRNLRVYHAKSEASNSKVSSRAFPHRKLLAETPSAKLGEKRKRVTAAAADPLSYEGTRSSKKGVKKTTSWQSRNKNENGGSMTLKRRPPPPTTWNEHKEGGKKKRPAVAARKAKQLKKRKLSNSTDTSEYAHPNKRARSQ